MALIFPKLRGAKISLKSCSEDNFVQGLKEARLAVGENSTEYRFDKKRCRILSDCQDVKEHSNGILYWMLRDCRVQDNWAMLFAQRLALKNKLPFHVCFFSKPCPILFPTRRHYSFLMTGLEEVGAECKDLNITFHLINADPAEELVKIVKENNLGAVVCEFFLLRRPREWQDSLKEHLPEDVPLVQVDAHNIVPAWIASEKQETAARTIRPKITKKLDEYLVGFPNVCYHPYTDSLIIHCKIENKALMNALIHTKLKTDVKFTVSRFLGNLLHRVSVSPVYYSKLHATMESFTTLPYMVPETARPLSLTNPTNFENALSNFWSEAVVVASEITWAIPGTEAGLGVLFNFVTKLLQHYAESSGNPCKDATSNLSPWLHFGHVSAQRCALEAKNFEEDSEASVAKFLDELIIRKELTDNFCYYNENYDNFDGADEWAKKTLNLHRKDRREFIYTKEQFEKAVTHDEIWNAAQLQLLHEGKIHNYMRMYWCKKILEWTVSPEQAIEYGLYLNDTYSLDGNDPNGFVGVMWSICGIHDHGWAEREVFGKIRFMVFWSMQRKFDADAYCARYGRKIHKTTAPNRKNKEVSKGTVNTKTGGKRNEESGTGEENTKKRKK